MQDLSYLSSDADLLLELLQLLGVHLEECGFEENLKEMVCFG